MRSVSVVKLYVFECALFLLVWSGFIVLCGQVTNTGSLFLSQIILWCLPHKNSYLSV